jgi:hypothetical protein
MTIVEILTAWHRDEATDEAEAAHYAAKLIGELAKDGYQIVPMTNDTPCKVERILHEVLFPLVGDLNTSGAIPESVRDMLWTRINDISDRKPDREED